MRVDATDVLATLGLALMSVGLWMVSPALALLVIGLMLFCLGIVAGIRGGQG